MGPGQTVNLQIAYTSRGRDQWSYVPTEGVETLEGYQLRMRTDFEAIDFPVGTLSPSTRARAGDGWELAWTFARAVTGQGMGMVMPRHIQPGELAATLAFSAPISLFFFLLVMWTLAVLRRLDLHPINALFLSAAFFSFHLLFGYSVDQLGLAPAFVLASTVSILLVTSYMRLVVSARFAWVETAGAQLVYLVGFSLAHFFDGFTGLTVTVLGILTLYILMQLTGRLRWSEQAKDTPPVDDTPLPRTTRADGPVTPAAVPC